jgi:nicotinamidase-related amidase
VLATVLNAVDIGYRVIVVRDAVCNSSDEGRDMLMRLHHASGLGVTPPAHAG